MELSIRMVKCIVIILQLAVLVVSTAPECVVESQPDPIVELYPLDITGTINGTTAIIPIPYDVARSIVPAQYGILKHAYQALIPCLHQDMFPAVLEAVLDHDIQANGTHIDDFQRVAIRFPFVDRLNDGYSSFKYTSSILLSNNSAAVEGFKPYAEVYTGTFEPSCNAYASRGASKIGSTAYLGLGSSALEMEPAFNSTFETKSGNPYGIDIIKNVTNQPFFGAGNTMLCDHFITLYNSSLTVGENAPVSVLGNVSVTTPFYPVNTTFLHVWGYRLDNAFVEHILTPCESLKGYTATGSGD